MEGLREEVATTIAFGIDADLSSVEIADAAIALVVELCAQVAEEFTPGGWHYERDEDTGSIPGRIATAIRAQVTA